jgi:anti-anti-sigma regulatory factor/HAMP domain-containing protein
MSGVPAIGWLRALSLRAKLLIAFLLVALLSAGAAGGVSLFSTRTRLVNSVGTQLNEQANSDARNVGFVLESKILGLRTVALGETLQRTIATSNAEFASLDAAALQARLGERGQHWHTAPDTDRLIAEVIRSGLGVDLAEYKQNDKGHIVVMVVNRYGVQVGASDRSGTYSMAGEEWWQKAWNDGRGGSFIGQPDLPVNQQTPLIDIAEPIYGHGTKEVIGVIRASYRLSALISRLQNIHSAQAGHADLLTNERVLINSNATDPIDPVSIEALKTAQGKTFAIVQVRDHDELVSMAPVTATFPEVAALGWHLVLREDADTALEPVNRALENTLLTVAGLLLLVLVLATAIAEIISAPIKRMASAARQIADGDFQQRLGYASGDEIGRLAMSFDHMARSLELRIAAEQQAQAERLALQEQVIKAQAEHLKELSTPLIPLSARVLLLPLIGGIDAARSELILQGLLNGVAEHRARVVVIDLTGVPVIDLPVAQALLRAAQGTRLMGAAVMLAGIRAEVAQTLVGLGADLSQLPVFANLQAAIAQAERAPAGTTP